jgi:hypothetical protein
MLLKITVVARQRPGHDQAGIQTNANSTVAQQQRKGVFNEGRIVVISGEMSPDFPSFAL